MIMKQRGAAKTFKSFCGRKTLPEKNFSEKQSHSLFGNLSLSYKYYN